MKSVELRRGASADVSEAFAWYEGQERGLGGEFLVEFDAALDRIRAAPLQYQVRYRDLRSAKLRRFPYRVFYRDTPKCVVVVGCIHGNRDPVTWHARN